MALFPCFSNRKLSHCTFELLIPEACYTGGQSGTEDGNDMEGSGSSELRYGTRYFCKLREII